MGVGKQSHAKGRVAIQQTSAWGSGAPEMFDGMLHYLVREDGSTREGGCRGYPATGFLIIGATLHPAISPKQKTNRSLILAGSFASGMGTNPSFP